jgi:hypothetical protein
MISHFFFATVDMSLDELYSLFASASFQIYAKETIGSQRKLLEYAKVWIPASWEVSHRKQRGACT